MTRDQIKDQCDQIENAVNTANVLSYAEEFDIWHSREHSTLSIEIHADHDSAMVLVWIAALRAIADAMEGTKK